MKETDFVLAVRMFTDKFYLENFEKAETDREGYSSALRDAVDLIAKAVTVAEPKRKGWRSRRNRRSWIEEYQKKGIAIFEHRLIALTLGGLPGNQCPQ